MDSMLRRAAVPVAVVALLAGSAPGTVRADDTRIDSQDSLPRAVLQAGDLDVVLVLAGSRLFAFVDRADTNAPATVERLAVTAGRARWTLEESGPGLYRAANVMIGSGHIPLTVDLAAGAASGQYTAAIDVSETAPGRPAGHRSGWLWWAVALAAVATLAAVAGGRPARRIAAFGRAHALW